MRSDFSMLQLDMKLLYESGKGQIKAYIVFAGLMTFQ